MDADDYLAAVDRLAAQMAEQPLGFELFIAGLKGTSPDAEACVDFRGQVATPAELDEVVGYLEIGYFSDADPERAKAWWLFLFDINRAADRLRLVRTCALYDRNQPLFAGAPALFDSIRRREPAGTPDFELIDDRAISCVDGREIYRAGDGFAKLTPELQPRIANWARDAFPAVPRFFAAGPVGVSPRAAPHAAARGRVGSGGPEVVVDARAVSEHQDVRVLPPRGL